MNGEIFTQEELERNNKNKKELSELIQSKSALLLVGAGCSINLGYPSWLSLLTELERLEGGFSKNKTKREGDPLVYADDIKGYIAKCNNGDLDKYYNKLQQIFEPKPQSFSELHIMLLKLGFKGIVTTNYDVAIECALTNISSSRIEYIQILPDSKRLISKFFLSLEECNELPEYVLHLHGVYKNPENIILTYSDYRRVYGFDVVSETDESKQRIIEWRLHSKVLWALLATRRVVFVGFSFEDPYFKALLDLVAQDLWRWNSTIHFAILPISYKNSEEVKTKAMELRGTYGIETVFYIEGDDIHSGLCDAINEIARDCGVKSNTTWIEETNRRMRNL